MTRDPNISETNGRRFQTAMPLFEPASREAAAKGDWGSSPSLGQSHTEQAHARNSDPETSHKAASKVTNIGPVREGIVTLLREFGPMADEEIICRYRDRVIIGQFKNSTEQSIRSRRAELTRAPFGLVKACGTVKNPRGFDCTLWRLA